MYEIVAKLGQPCIFIRYNPDGKKSDIKLLLERIKYYLEFNLDNISEDDLENISENNFDEYKNYYEELGIDDMMGFNAEYLFY